MLFSKKPFLFNLALVAFFLANYAAVGYDYKHKYDAGSSGDDDDDDDDNAGGGGQKRGYKKKGGKKDSKQGASGGGKKGKYGRGKKVESGGKLREKKKEPNCFEASMDVTWSKRGLKDTVQYIKTKQ
jgi:hypothetical protein